MSLLRLAMVATIVPFTFAQKMARSPDDTCQYSHDGECDEPQFCTPGTDCSDCSNCKVARSPDDSCSYANDGACDEPNFCAVGTDCSDCQSCSGPDPCSSAPCLNGGVCSHLEAGNGHRILQSEGFDCVCTNGYSGSSCTVPHGWGDRTRSFLSPISSHHVDSLHSGIATRGRA